MTIQEAYKKTLYRLYELYDNREADNITNLLLEHITYQTKLDRVLYPTIPLNTQQQQQLEAFTLQLEKNIPIQYILEKAWFMGFAFYVNNNVLIPRPETEELVDWIVKDNPPDNDITIVDIGTGSGCIPISLKKKMINASVTSVDISEQALYVAAKNANSQEADVEFICMNFLKEDDRNTLETYDIIVSNPPYIKEIESSTMHERVLQNEPHAALFVPNNNALIFYNAIAAFGKEHLAENGRIYVEINEALAAETLAVFEQYGYETILRNDMQGKPRMIKAWLPTSH